MTRIAAQIAFLAALSPALLAAAAPQEPITLEQTSRGSGVPGVDLSVRLGTYSWGSDGEHVLLRRPGEDNVWIDPLTGERTEPAASEEAPRPQLEASQLELVRKTAPGAAGMSRSELEALAKALFLRPEQRSDDGAVSLVYHEQVLYTAHPEAGVQVIARGADGDIRYDRLSPDGRWVTYVRGNDLFLVSTADGSTRPITSNGGPDQFNGILDWVYQEEIYGRGDFQAHFWSPSSRHTAFISLDEEPVMEFTVVDHIEDGHFRVRPEVTNYPKVGDPNPIPRVGIAAAETGSTAWVDLSRYDGQEILIVRVGWTPDGARCLVHVQDRIQTWAELLSVDPETGAGTLLIREQSKAWTERPEPPIWLSDGSFLWHSHRTGPTHLYHYGADGTLIRAVTKGDWNLTRVVDVAEGEDGAPGHVLFQCTEGGDINVNLYRVELDGANFTRLTQGEGSHRVRWNEGRTMFIDQFSSLTNPGQVRVCDADGMVLLELETATFPAAEKHALGTWELHEVSTRDGVVLDAALLKPADFDPKKSYAVWISTYSGPAAPSVRNRWRASSFFHFLNQQGVIVLQANVRSSTSRGPGATAALYRRVGLQEVEDMVDVLDWLTANPWADGERVGITGYSFGGTMTANCLLRTDRFALGVAGGGVYDWRMYDTIYTERYMRTPADNLEGYEATSVLAQAGNLTGFLHMHHGIMDDNVHVQNMFQMASALMEAKEFDWSMMAYPRTRHGIRDPELAWHARRTEWALIEEHLLGR